MSLIDTDLIWRALGDFFDLFPDEERVYWNTFWDVYADLVADVWGLAFQTDRAKSLFATTPTFERREVLVKLSNLTQDSVSQFRVSQIDNANGLWTLRGFVSDDLRTIRETDIPDQGLVRLGTEILNYSRANITAYTEGINKGYVREATFVLSQSPAHDYGDDPDFNDDFRDQPLNLELSIDHVAGDTDVDAVAAGVVDLNATGKLDLDSEELEYASFTDMGGGHYVFHLPTTYQPPATSAPELEFDHAAGTRLVVHRRDVGRWGQRTLGAARIIGDGNATMVIDQAPVPAAARAELLGQYRLQANDDFDVAVFVTLSTWPVPAVVSSSRGVYARLVLGSNSYPLGLVSRRSGAGVVSHWLTAAGVETVIDDVPEAFELRLSRAGNVLALQYRETGAQDFTVLTKVTVTGERATLDLVLDDPDSGAPSRVVFDEVLRRRGKIVGQERLEEFFTVSALFAHHYDIDQRLTSAQEFRDYPRTRSETLTTVSTITSRDPKTIVARGRGEEFSASGVPTAGTLVIGTQNLVYDQVTVSGDQFGFHIRGQLDPDLVPVAAGTVVVASTRVLTADVDFRLPGDGTLDLRDLPTRDRLWTPVAQIDGQHVQKTYGQFVDLKADVSTDAYLRRVQGTWAALMTGPSYRNMATGLQLAMGLPVAKIDGRVVAKTEYFDVLGQRVRRTMTIQGDRGRVEHDLDPGLYPHIDWILDLGSPVDRFQPLTNGVGLWDVVSDPLWHLRFPGASEVERFNTFGVHVAIEAQGPDASIADAIRFALRAKPTFTKLIIRYLLTSGDEDLSQEVLDDLAATLIPHVCEDMTFDEGEPEPDEIWRLGDGHRLGQHGHLDNVNRWRYETLGEYTRQGPFAEDGAVTAGSNVFTGRGGYSFVDIEASGDGGVTLDGDIFTTAGAWSFSAADLGKWVCPLGIADAGRYEILEVLGPGNVRVDHVFTATATAVDWQLRSSGFVASDVYKDVYIHDQGPLQIQSVLTPKTVGVLHTFAATQSGLTWELRDYARLGEGRQLGTARAYACPPPSENEPNEYVTSEQVVTVAMVP